MRLRTATPKRRWVTIVTVFTLCISLAIPASAAEEPSQDLAVTDLAVGPELELSAMSTDNPQVELTGGGNRLQLGRTSAVAPVAARTGPAGSEFIGTHLDDIVTVEKDAVGFATRIKDRRAPTAIDYTFDGAGSIHLDQETGGLAVYDAAGELLALVAAPWAVDANGEAVETFYTVSGTTVTQHVRHRNGAAYPVIADPKVHFGLLLHITLTYSEVKAIYNNLEGAVTNAATIAASVCSYLARASALAAGACGVIIGFYASQIWSSIKTARSKSQCLDFAFSYNPVLPGALIYWKRVSQSDNLCE